MDAPEGAASVIVVLRGRSPLTQRHQRPDQENDGTGVLRRFGRIICNSRGPLSSISPMSQTPEERRPASQRLGSDRFGTHSHSRLVPTRSHHLGQHIGSPLFRFRPIREHHFHRCGFPETELNSRNEPQPRPQPLDSHVERHVNEHPLAHAIESSKDGEHVFEFSATRRRCDSSSVILSRPTDAASCPWWSGATMRFPATSQYGASQPSRRST